jgi:hypothetical protein
MRAIKQGRLGSAAIAEATLSRTPLISSSPCGELAKRIAPDFPGRTPPVFPAEWLAGLRA